MKPVPDKPVYIKTGNKKGSALKAAQRANKEKQHQYEQALEDVRRWNAGLNIDEVDFNLKLADCYRLNKRDMGRRIPYSWSV